MNYPIKVIIQNFYQVSIGYNYTGKSYEEFRIIMKKNAKKSFKKLISKIELKGVDVEAVYSHDKDDNPVKLIRVTAKEHKIDGIIFGAKGRSATTALFIGSGAEKLIGIDLNIPIMVVRSKGKQAGIIDYLKEI